MPCERSKAWTKAYILACMQSWPACSICTDLETERMRLQVQERLFEQLMQLLATAAAGSAGARGGALRQLSCKAEEVHTTLRKHLAKEEEQLFPLLLAHFSVAEQAELVAQFLCCIPLAAVEAVLAWLKPAVPQAEQEDLLAQAPPRRVLRRMRGCKDICTF